MTVRQRLESVKCSALVASDTDGLIGPCREALAAAAEERAIERAEVILGRKDGA
jgi:hypothetical protein